MTVHGISEQTHQRILMGPGAVSTASGLLGATKGGNVCEINRTFRDIRPDGSKGKVMGYRKLEESEAILTVRLMEFTEDIVYYALAGSSLLTHVIAGGDIDADTYISYVEISAELTGSTIATEASGVVIRLDNCLVEGPLTINLPEKGETVTELKFHAHFDPSDMDEEPWTVTFTPVGS